MVSAHPDADRRARQCARLARVLRLLQLIQGRARWDAVSLAAELECSPRTVFRDLQVLTLAGVPWYFDGQEQSYRVRPDYRFPVPALTEDEALGQAVAAVLATAPGLDVALGARSAAAKLAAAAPERSRQILAAAGQLVSVLGLKLADHSRHREIIQTAQWALLRRRHLEGRYRSPYQDRAVTLRLHPYRLCLVQQAWYLIAQPCGREGARTYRLARFRSLRMLDAPAEVPADFDLKAYFGNAWGVYRGERSYEVEIEFTAEAAELVTETTWHPTQRVKRHRDGRATLAFVVDGLEEIVWWVLGWSGRARVVRPAELRERVMEQLQKAVGLHRVAL